MHWILAIIVGLLVTAGSDLLQGLIAGALLWMVPRSLDQAKQIAALQQRVEELQSRPAEPVALPLPSAAKLAPEATPAKVSPRDTAWWTPALPLPVASETTALADPPIADPPVAVPEPQVTASDAPAEPPALPTEQSPTPTTTPIREPLPPLPPLPIFVPPPPEPAPADPLAPIKAWLLGGNTIVKVGVGILFIGLAFLARYASDYIPIELRLAAIAAVALGLLALGWRLRTKRPGYAQVLQGGAVAVLYLTLFAAFRFYHVLPVLPVFAMMVGVAALSAVLAVLQDARALAVIGALGGFAAPLLVSTGSGNHVALFSYYLVLDLGIAAVAWVRTWRSLNLIGFVGTFVIGSAWGVLKYRTEHFASSESFLIAYFLLFIAILLMPARRSAAGDMSWVNGSLLFGLPTITFALQYGLVQDTEYGTAISAAALGGFYLLLAAWMRPRPPWASAFEASLTIGTLFLTLAIPFAVDARSTAGAWAFEGAGLLWLGFRQQRRSSRLIGYALLLLAAGPLLHTFDRYETPTHLLNGHLLAALMLAAGSLAAAYFVQRFLGAAEDGELDQPIPTLGNERTAEPLLIAWGTLWLLVAIGVQLDAFVPPDRALAAWLVSFSAIAVVYTALADRLRWRWIAVPVLAHAPLLGLCTLISATTPGSPAVNGGAWAWPLALLTHLVVLWRAAPRWSTQQQIPAHVIGVLVLAALGGLQGRAITADWGEPGSAWVWLGWPIVPAALLLLLSRPGAALRWPVRAAPSAYRTIAGAVLTAALLYWALVANFASDGAARPLPHIPLLNPLDLAIGLALSASWVWMRNDTARSWLGDAPPWVLAGAGFLWLNAIMVRAFHHFGGVPFSGDDVFGSLAVQTGFTLMWSVLALIVMWLAARRSARAPWMVGAVLLAVVVVKLLLVDLSASDTVTRIISFIGVGLLMLIIGFVAPLPTTGRSTKD